ncbi:MAG: hypothetical protein IKJ36_01900 [Clostridia bacterium]|nr:hypothetical protein [Clostridia bacterium]
MTNDKIKMIQLFIKEHIEEISGKNIPKGDRELSYSMIHDEVTTLIKYYNESQDSQHRNFLTKTLLEVQDELFNYLARVNCEDKQILAIYKILVSAIYNI